MRESIRNAAAVAVALAVAVSCSSNGGVMGGGESTGGPPLGTVGGRPGPSDTGAIGLRLTIGNGVHVNQLSWTISNGVNSYSGIENITDDAGHEAQSVEFVAGGIIAGSGYVVTLSGSDTAGDPCTGTSAAVTVKAGVTASASILVTCTMPTDAAIGADVANGIIAINAPVTLQTQPPFGCPGIAGTSISPSELLPPETAALTAQVVGGDGGTQTLLWTSSCGTITNPTSASATFSCGATTGTCTVTLTVGLDGTGLDGGSVGQVCTGVAFTTASEVVTCEPQCTIASDCPTSPTLCQVPACVSNRCTVNSASQGTSCSDNGGTICDGGGNCVVAAFDVVRVGTGTALVAGQTAAAFIDQYSIGGTLRSTIALPTAVSGSNLALTLIDNDTAEGDLTTSVDGRFVVMAGHNFAPGTTISSSNCVGALINSAGTVNTSNAFTNALAAGGSVRSAGSLDGSELWVAGSATDTTGGLWYMTTPGGSNVQVVQTSTSGPQARWLRIAGGQLYGDSNTNPPGLFPVGSGTPTTSVAAHGASPSSTSQASRPCTSPTIEPPPAEGSQSSRSAGELGQMSGASQVSLTVRTGGRGSPASAVWQAMPRETR